MPVWLHNTFEVLGIIGVYGTLVAVAAIWMHARSNKPGRLIVPDSWIITDEMRDDGYIHESEVGRARRN